LWWCERRKDRQEVVNEVVESLSIFTAWYTRNVRTCVRSSNGCAVARELDELLRGRPNIVVSEPPAMRNEGLFEWDAVPDSTSGKDSRPEF
jgi:hypothetical protein